MSQVRMNIPLGVSSELHVEVGRAVAAWLTLAETAELARPVEITLQGGAYISPDDAAAFWDVLLATDAVVDLPVEGNSCRSSATAGRPFTLEII